MPDPYQHYLDNLAGKQPPIHESEPQPGYYRRRNGKGGPWIAAAIWRGDDGELMCRVGWAMVPAPQHWTWLARHPVPEADAKHWFERGRWPGEAAPAEPAPGHNNPPPDTREPLPDARDELANRIDAELAAARQWLTQIGGKIGSAEQDAELANRIGTVRGLIAKLKSVKDAECGPLHAAWKDAVARYSPLLDRLDKSREYLLGLATKWKLAEQERQEAERARVEAERARIEAEQKAKEPDPFELPLAPELPEVPSVDVSSGGITGRKVGLRKYTICIVTDHAKALRKFKDHPEIVALVAKLAERALKAGETVPGAELRDEQRAA